MAGEGPPPRCWRHSSFLPHWSGWRRTPPDRWARRGCGPGRPRPIPLPCATRSGPSRCPTSTPPSSYWPCRAACSRARGWPSSRSPSPPRASSPLIWRGWHGTLLEPRRCASRDLARARQAVREARERLVRKLAAILGGLDAGDRAPDAGVTLRGGRYVIPIKSTARARVGGIVHDESATRATVFVEPAEVIELGNELRAAEAAEQREVLRVLRELSELARPHRETIARAWEMCIAFDDLCARARYAIEVNGFAPA